MAGNTKAARNSTDARAASEIQDYLILSQQRRRLYPRAALAGLIAGIVAVAFRLVLAVADGLRTALISWAHRMPAIGWLFPVLFGAAGSAFSVFLVRHYAPEAAGSGIPHLEAVLQRLREFRWKRILAVKFAGGAASIGAGLALGREGPTVQMGGAAGAAVARWVNAGTRDKMVLIAAGAGAGLAAAFNAPLAGVMFVLEEVQKDFRQAVFASAFIAAAVADIVARFAAGQLPVFKVPSYPVPDLRVLPVFAVAGAISGLLGVVYNRSLIGTMDLFSRLPARYALHTAAAVGGAVGLVAWFSPGAVGGGHSLAETFLAGKTVLVAIPIWFVLRFVISMASYATGAPGGIFAPLLVLGALIGLGVGDVAHLFWPHLIPVPASFAVVCMAAFFTAIVRAPLTGIVLILEMTGNYAQMLPLLVACFCAYAVAEGMGELPVYEHLLERDLHRGGILPDPNEPLVVELEVKPGSLFEGKEVRSLGLPPGCILVSCRNGQHEWVPRAMSRLSAHTRITSLIGPEAKGALEILRNGCESQR